MGFAWFIWAFEGFVLFFCILHLIGESLLAAVCLQICDVSLLLVSLACCYYSGCLHRFGIKRGYFAY